MATVMGLVYTVFTYLKDFLAKFVDAKILDMIDDAIKSYVPDLGE